MLQDSAETGSKTLNSHQLQKLHRILKPFMLRRVKRDVEHEMAAKIEVQVNCHLSKRQRVLYQALQGKVCCCHWLLVVDRLLALDDFRLPRTRPAP